MLTQDLTLLRLDPATVRRAHFLDLQFAVISSGRQRIVTVAQGVVTVSGEGDHKTRAFTINAEESAWAEFSRQMPRPGYQDIIAMVESGHATVEGEMLLFFRNLFFVKAALAGVFGKEWT